MVMFSQRGDDFGTEFSAFLLLIVAKFYQRFGRKAITTLPAQRMVFETPLPAAYSGLLAGHSHSRICAITSLGKGSATCQARSARWCNLNRTPQKEFPPVNPARRALAS
jgi:hypothetical protein